MRIVIRSLLTALAFLPATAIAEPIVVTLHETASVSKGQATLGDVAALEGGEEEQRRRLGRLDLTDLPLSSQPTLISRHQIEFRLRLAGLDDDAFRLEGPNYVRVSRPAGEALDEKIVAVARQALERQLATQAADAIVQLTQPVRVPPLSVDGDDIHLEAEVRTATAPPCRALVEVGIYVRGARRTSAQVYLDVKKVQSAPVALRRIEAGEIFAPENVRIERAPLDYGGKPAVDAAALMGQKARRPIVAGQRIEAEDLDSVGVSGVVIHQSDLVHIVAPVGPLQVRARGQAMQDGRIGQLIQVRNTDSQSIVTGRVKDHSTVEVDY